MEEVSFAFYYYFYEFKLIIAGVVMFGEICRKSGSH